MKQLDLAATITLELVTAISGVFFFLYIVKNIYRRLIKIENV